MKLALAALLLGLAQDKKEPAFDPIQDDPKLPRVLLIGDSISIGYTLPLRKLLEGKANVHRIPENGGPTSNGTAKIDRWIEGKWDVIHVNWGLHDLKLVDGKHQVSLEDYEKNLRELVKKLKATGAKVVWASTTPVPDAKTNPPRKAEDVPRFNEVAKKVVDENQIAIDDLYTFALPKLKEIQLPANVHYTPKGYEALAGEVAKSILAALPAR